MNRTDMKQKKKDPNTIPPPAKDSPWSMNREEFEQLKADIKANDLRVTNVKANRLRVTIVSRADGRPIG